MPRNVRVAIQIRPIPIRVRGERNVLWRASPSPPPIKTIGSRNEPTPNSPKLKENIAAPA
jgi:hypothetical protein